MRTDDNGRDGRMADRHLPNFQALIKAGSIRGAAEALHVATSAISRQIAALEGDCGGPLLERLPQGVVPTETGRTVAEYAQRRAYAAALPQDRLRRIRGAEAGTVRVGSCGGFLTELLDNGPPPRRCLRLRGLINKALA